MASIPDRQSFSPDRSDYPDILPLDSPPNSGSSDRSSRSASRIASPIFSAYVVTDPEPVVVRVPPVSTEDLDRALATFSALQDQIDLQDTLIEDYQTLEHGRSRLQKILDGDLP